MKNYEASYGITIDEISEKDIEEIMKAVTPILEREKKQDWIGEKEMLKEWDNDSRSDLNKDLCELMVFVHVGHDKEKIMDKIEDIMQEVRSLKHIRGPITKT